MADQTYSFVINSKDRIAGNINNATYKIRFPYSSFVIEKDIGIEVIQFKEGCVILNPSTQDYGSLLPHSTFDYIGNTSIIYRNAGNFDVVIEQINPNNVIQNPFGQIILLKYSSLWR